MKKKRKKIFLAAAAVIEQDGKVLIAKRKKHDTHGGKWEFPGGGKKPGESLAACLRRELREELNVAVTPGELIGRSEFSLNRRTVRLMFYRARLRSRTFKLNEHDAIRWVAPARLGRYAFPEADAAIIRLLRERALGRMP